MNISQKKLEKSKGRLEIKIKDQNLQKLYQQGSLKALMPDFHENLKQLMLINTAGGITSGDEYNYDIEIDKSISVFQLKLQKRFTVGSEIQPT